MSFITWLKFQLKTTMKSGWAVFSRFWSYKPNRKYLSYLYIVVIDTLNLFEQLTKNLMFLSEYGKILVQTKVGAQSKLQIPRTKNCSSLNHIASQLHKLNQWGLRLRKKSSWGFQTKCLHLILVYVSRFYLILNTLLR